MLTATAIVRALEPNMRLDPYGSAMSLFSDLCHYLGAETTINPEAQDWDFAPGVLGYSLADISAYRIAEFRSYRADELERAGNLLNRYIAQLQHAGLSY